jgi:hypothetical protein
MNQVMAFLSLSDGEFGVARLNDGLVLSMAHVQALVDVDPSGSAWLLKASPQVSGLGLTLRAPNRRYE